MMNSYHIINLIMNTFISIILVLFIRHDIINIVTTTTITKTSRSAGRAESKIIITNNDDERTYNDDREALDRK